MVYTPGPYFIPHMYLQWGGSLPGSEQWTNGIRLANTGDGEYVIPEGSIDGLLSGAIATALSAWHSGSGSVVAPSAKLEWAKLNAIDVSGHYIEGVTHEYVWGTPVAGGGAGSPTPPNQLALAVTWTTAYARGPAHQGRLYLPTPVVNVDSTSGLFSALQANGVEAAANTFYAALNTAVETVEAGMRCCIMSRKSGAATRRMITGAKVGRVLDTQRRRRRSLPESYVS